MGTHRSLSGRDARRRIARLGVTVAGVAVTSAFVVLSASAESPAPAATASPAASLSSSPESVPTPGASDNGWLFATPEPLPIGPAASAPPLPSPVAHPPVTGVDQCIECHDAVNDEQAAIVAEWQTSTHAAARVSCADCHGGDPGADQITKAMDPSIGYAGVPGRLESVALCGSCHANVTKMGVSRLPTDQYAKYWSSVHGQRLLAEGDTRVAICTDCHGEHAVRKVSDPESRVFALNIPNLCASCHADARRMEPYGIPTDQFDVYAGSVHGIALLENKDVRAPSCASCHGSHDAKPPTSSTVVEVCGTCHTATQELFEQSRHSELQAAAPKCWTCHGTHDVAQPSSSLFFHEQAPQYTCVTCHDLDTHRLRLELDRFAAAGDRRCDTCHHPDSQIYTQIEGISAAVISAESAYEQADAHIKRAAGLGMITEDAEVALVGARTSLIQAQAAVHTTKLPEIAKLASEARTKADEARALASSKIDESVFRRQAMVIVLALILATVAFLVATKRRLDRELEAGEVESPGPGG